MKGSSHRVHLLGRPHFWMGVAGAAAILVYLRTLRFGWVYDDQMDIVLHRFVQDWRAVPDLFTTTVWAGSGMETHLYRPLTQVSFLLNHVVSGLEPWSYHLLNLILHAAITILVLRVGMRWGLSTAAAGVGALLFALHPVHVEVVAAAHGRKDLLAAVFVLGLYLAHGRARDGGSAWTAGAVLLLACALLSKETGLVAVLLVAVADLASPQGRRRLRTSRVQGIYAAYGATLLLYLAVRMRVTGTFGVPDTSVFDNPLVAADLPVRIGTALVVVGRGLTTLVLPSTLSPDYSFDAIPLVRGLVDPRLWATLTVLAVLGWTAYRFRGRHSWIPLALVWYALTLLPASNLLLPVGTIFGDRLLYLPSVAFCLALGGTLGLLHRRAARGPGRTATLFAIGLLCVGFAGRTWHYSGAWNDDIALFEWAVKAVPNSTRAHHKLGEEYLRAGRLGDALPPLDRALEIAPGNAFAAETRNQAVAMLLDRYQDVLRDPLVSPLPDDPRILDALADLLQARGRPDGARRLMRTADSLRTVEPP